MIITSENGTGITETRQAAGHAGKLLRYYAGLADYVDQIDQRPFPGVEDQFTEVVRQPRGVAALIAPWNFPVALVMVKLAPALIAGCTVVIKPASETPLDLRILMESALAAGIPEGVLNLITCGRDVVGALVEHPLVAKVAFTGSTGVGRLLAEQCGRLLRPVTLELGGKSASIVLPDANLDYFASMLNRTCLRNTGQTCYNSTRILAPRSIYNDVVDAVATVVGNTVIGDPFDPATDYAPSASKKQSATVADYIRIGQEEGARVAVGGSGMPEGITRGYYNKPTVFADVNNQMRVAREEIFGPVLSVIRVKTYDEALKLVNDHQYGNGTAIFTNDGGAARRFQNEVEVGMVGINVPIPVPMAYFSFGGWKNSLFGDSHAHGTEGVHFFTRGKVVTSRWLDPSHGGINLGFPQNT